MFLKSYHYTRASITWGNHHNKMFEIFADHQTAVNVVIVIAQHPASGNTRIEKQIMFMQLPKLLQYQRIPERSTVLR